MWLMNQLELEQLAKDNKITIVKRLANMRGGMGTYALDQFLIIINNLYYILTKERRSEAETRTPPEGKVWEYEGCVIYTIELHTAKYQVEEGKDDVWIQDEEQFKSLHYENNEVNSGEEYRPKFSSALSEGTL